MTENFEARKENLDNGYKPVLEIGFEVIQTYPVRIERFVMCNGIEHWSSEEVLDSKGNVDTAAPATKVSSEKVPCNCPDLNNRVSIWDKFKS